MRRVEFKAGPMSINPRKIAQGGIVLLVSGLSIALAFGIWKGKAARTTHESQRPPVADSEMKLTEMEFTEMEQGKRFWTLHASEATYLHDQQKTILNSVHLVFYLKNGQEIQLESKKGILHAGTKKIELRDAVQVALPRGYVLTSDEADYDHQDRVITSDHPIHLSGPGAEMDGRTWSYRLKDQSGSVSGGVTASLVGARLKLDKTN